MITIFDWETTGLEQPEGNHPNVQPFAIEIYAMQVDEDGNLINELETFVKPPTPISPLITKITGITNNDLRDAPTFAEIYRDLSAVFFGSHTSVAHNLAFDKSIIIHESRRIGKEHNFPYPPIDFCTVEQSLHIKGHRLKNSELFEIATGKTLEGAHRARVDVQATYESYLWLRSQNVA